MPEFHITARPPHASDLCMECKRVRVPIYAFRLGVFQLRLCRDCLAQLGREIGEALEGGNDAHS